MINAIASRCDVIPWEFCVLFIDEIDSLAPNRADPNVSADQVEGTYLFQALIDGNKKKDNLFIMGTTNFIEKIADAFLQRMDIKIFIGLPSQDSREVWIEKTVQKWLNEINEPNYVDDDEGRLGTRGY